MHGRKVIGWGITDELKRREGGDTRAAASPDTVAQSGSKLVASPSVSPCACVRACEIEVRVCVRVNAKLRKCAAPVCVCVSARACARVLHVCVCACACVCVCVCLRVYLGVRFPAPARARKPGTGAQTRPRPRGALPSAQLWLLVLSRPLSRRSSTSFRRPLPCSARQSRPRHARASSAFTSSIHTPSSRLHAPCAIQQQATVMVLLDASSIARNVGRDLSLQRAVALRARILT
jgi:hypothetical protein